MAQTPEGVLTPASCPKFKQKAIMNELENWNEHEELDYSYQGNQQGNSYGLAQNCSSTSGYFTNDQNDYETSDYDVHQCKAPFTDMAFDLRNYSEVHKNCSHSHSNINILLMERISIFRQKMPARCKKSMIEVFDELVNKFLNLTSSDPKNFKIYRFDPFADAMLLIIANEINMPKNVFLECLSIETRLVPSKITEVKKYSCYRKLKSLFDKTLATKVN